MSNPEEKGNNGDTAASVNWPTNSLSPEQLNEIIQLSKNRPLRLIIAEIIIKEGKTLRESLNPRINGRRTNEDIAIHDGYTRTGRLILSGEEYLQDEEGAVQKKIQIFQLFAGINENPQSIDEKTLAALRETFRKSMLNAKKSFSTDPSGVDWLNQWLQKKDLVFNTISQLKNDPEVIGLKIGMNRYKKLYAQAVLAGAKRDRRP